MKDYQRIEGLLLDFKRKPVPPELKAKILNFSNEESVQIRPLVNSCRRVVAVCSVMVVVIFLLETKISKDQIQKVSSLQTTSFKSQVLELHRELAIVFEPLDETHDSLYLSWLTHRYCRKKRTAKRPGKRRGFYMSVEDLNGSEG